jgi:hypothetical protein
MNIKTMSVEELRQGIKVKKSLVESYRRLSHFANVIHCDVTKRKGPRSFHMCFRETKYSDLHRKYGNRIFDVEDDLLNLKMELSHREDSCTFSYLGY